MCDGSIWVCLSYAAAVVASVTLQALEQPPDSNLFRFGLGVLKLSKLFLHLHPDICMALLATPHVKRVEVKRVGAELTTLILLETMAGAEKEGTPSAVATASEVTPQNYQEVCGAVSSTARGAKIKHSMHRLCLC